MSDLQDKVALVTGGSRGIGRAICLELASRGAKVVVNYNSSAEAANDVVSAIDAGGGAAFAVQADVGAVDNVDALFKSVLAEFKTIDILVNNAGMTLDNVIMMTKPNDFRYRDFYQPSQLLAVQQGGGPYYAAQTQRKLSSISRASSVLRATVVRAAMPPAKPVSSASPNRWRRNSPSAVYASTLSRRVS